MPFDGIVLKAVSNEINLALLNGRVEKIFQPSRDEVFINIYSNNSKMRLLASANAAYPRIHLTASEPFNMPLVSNFCILLRKHLTGSKLTHIFQPGLERILELKFEGTDDIGDPTIRYFVIEIMGKHSNLILLNQNRKIIDSIKHVGMETSRLREIMPGRDYLYPNTQDKLSIFDSEANNMIRKIFSSDDTDNIHKYILDSFAGFSLFASREFAKEVFSYKEGNGYQDIASRVLQDTIAGLNLNSLKPYIMRDENGKPLDFHCLFFSHFNADSIKKYPSISKAVEDYYNSKSFYNKLTSRKAELSNAVNYKLKKCIKKIGIQTKNLSDSENKEDLKLYGELITSNLYRISEGAEEITVTNYYSPNCAELTILLNPSISPASNAQAYFKKYSKAKKTHEAAASLLSQLEKDKVYFENLLYQIEDAGTDNDIKEIRNELVNEKIISEKSKSKKTVLPLVPLEFISSDGFVILVGKNNRQNDHLTFKTAARTDFWLHTRNIPGSHVIIKAEKKEVPESTLIEACTLAAYHSKSRNSTHVPVDYTQVKYVKKPAGAKPGFVIYENFKTITVNPDLSLVERLKK